MVANVSEELLAGLNDEQVAAVTHLSGPLLVVAGPGSGKTAVLTRRTAALLDAGVPPWRVAAVTFTNRAASEMRTRLDRLVGPAAGQAQVSTFHALCARVLRRHYEAAGLPRNFTVADSRDSLAVMGSVAADLGVTDDVSGKEAVTLVREARRKVSWAKNAGVLRAADWHPERPDEETARLWAGYEKVMASSGVVDFDDLLTKVVALGADPEVGVWLRSRFDRFLVDEYQDTNPVQQLLTEMFAGPDGQVCAVGDPDQSVYAFRGATGSVADVFVRRWPNAAVVKLGRNYRSTATICAVSAAVIAPNPGKHRATPTSSSGAGQGAKVVELVADDPGAEAVWAARTLAAKVASSPAGFSAAVLVRANHQTRELEKALTGAGVRHALLGTLRFADRAEVRDVTAWLRLAVNPHDQVAAMRAAGVPRRGLGPVAAAAIRDRMSDGDDVCEAARAVAAASSRAARAATSFADEVEHVSQVCAEVGLVAALVALRDRVGVFRAAVGQGEGSAEREENVSELVSYATSFADDQAQAGLPVGGQVAAFCEALSLASSDAPGPDGADTPPAVVIATIHAAKGKEFDWVMVAGCEEGVLPHARSQSPEEVAEERRLMFVACSRPRFELVLSRCSERMTFGRLEANAASRFLADVPASLTVGQVAAQVRRREQATRAPAWKPPRRNMSSPPRPAPLPGRVFAAGQAVSHHTFGAGSVVGHDAASGQVRVRFASGPERVFIDSTPMLVVSPTSTR